MRPNEPETGGGVDAFRTTGSRILDRIRDRRGDLLFGLAAGGVVAAVIGFMMVTNPDQPLLPRIGSAFTLNVGEYGEPYIVVDPSALDEEAGGSTGRAEAQESGRDAGTPALLLFPIDGLGRQSSGGGNGSGGTDQDPSTDPEAPPPAGDDQEPAPDEEPTPEPEPSPGSSPPPSTDPSTPTDPSPTPEPPEPSPTPEPSPEPTKPPKPPKEPKEPPEPEPSPPPEP